MYLHRFSKILSVLLCGVVTSGQRTYNHLNNTDAVAVPGLLSTRVGNCGYGTNNTCDPVVIAGFCDATCGCAGFNSNGCGFSAGYCSGAYRSPLRFQVAKRLCKCQLRVHFGGIHGHYSLHCAGSTFDNPCSKHTPVRLQAGPVPWRPPVAVPPVEDYHYPPEEPSQAASLV